MSHFGRLKLLPRNALVACKSRSSGSPVNLPLNGCSGSTASPNSTALIRAGASRRNARFRFGQAGGGAVGRARIHGRRCAQRARRTGAGVARDWRALRSDLTRRHALGGPFFALLPAAAPTAEATPHCSRHRQDPPDASFRRGGAWNVLKEMIEATIRCPKRLVSSAASAAIRTSACSSASSPASSRSAKGPRRNRQSAARIIEKPGIDLYSPLLKVLRTRAAGGNLGFW